MASKSKDGQKPSREDSDEAVDMPSELPPPPDGGWGWVIVATSFMASFILDGVNYSFSPSLEAMTTYFNEPRGKVAWVGSLIPGVYNLTGPLASALSNKFGLRPVCIVGAMITSVAYFLTIFASSVEYLMVVQGIMGGFGFGLVFLPVIVVVGYYFEKKRAMATGIAVCGSGVGTFVFPPVMYALIDKYGWKGANLILSGVILNICWMGGLMRPLRAPKMKKKELIERLKTEEIDGIPIIQISQPKEDQIVKAKIVPAVMYSSAYSTLETFGSRDSRKFPVSSLARAGEQSIPLRRKSSLKDSITIRPMSRQDVFYTGSITNIKEFKREGSFASYRQSTMDVAGLGASKIILNTLAEEKKTKKDSSKSSSFKQLLDFTLFKDKRFILFTLAYICAFLALLTPFMFLPAAAIEKGVDKNSATFLVSICGICNTVGRVMAGMIGNIGRIKPLWVNNFCQIMAGIIVFITPFFSSYLSFALVSGGFGFFVAAFPALMSPIFADVFGLEKLSNAFGFTILFCGISSMCGAPIAGTMYDITGSYDASFYYAGTSLIMSGALMCLVPLLDR